jgi:hypothetical protein
MGRGGTINHGDNDLVNVVTSAQPNIKRSK